MEIEERASIINMDDQELVQRALEGESEACREIFERCVDLVFYISSIYTKGDREAAKDLVQLVFAKAFENLGSLGPPYNFTAWCAKIAHNCGIDHVKKHVREREGIGEYLKISEMGNLDPEQIILINEALRAVADSFDTGIEGSLKETARLFYSEDKSVEEIAAELDVSKTVVTTRLSRFRARMRELVVKKLAGD